MPSNSIYKNIKLLINEETMTNNNKKNLKNKNKDNDKDNYLEYLISTKIFGKYNSKKQNAHLNTFNFNYDEYCKKIKDKYFYYINIINKNFIVIKISIIIN